MTEERRPARMEHISLLHIQRRNIAGLVVVKKARKLDKERKLTSARDGGNDDLVRGSHRYSIKLGLGNRKVMHHSDGMEKGEV